MSFLNQSCKQTCQAAFKALSKRPRPGDIVSERLRNPLAFCAAWNANETLLAVICSRTRKSSHGIELYGAPTGASRNFRLLLRVQDTWLPPLAVTFHPVNPGLMVFCEGVRNIHILGRPILPPQTPPSL